MDIYFVDDQHRQNFEKLLVKFPDARLLGNGSYRSTCYLAALPEIFKCFTLSKQRHGPFSWYMYLSDDELTEKEYEQVKREYGATLAPLTSGTRALCELAWSLWNGHGFGVDQITEMDPDLYRVVLQALELRRRRQTIDMTRIHAN